jgi:hypothetical protein
MPRVAGRGGGGSDPSTIPPRLYPPPPFQRAPCQPSSFLPKRFMRSICRLLHFFTHPGVQPNSFMRNAFSGEGPEAIKMLHGTTTLGFVFQHGIIICVDSRASQGQYVGAVSTGALLRMQLSTKRALQQFETMSTARRFPDCEEGD